MIIAATHNKGKILEFERILSKYGISIMPCEDNELLSNIVEDGNSFEENSLIKAKAVYEKYRQPVLADDSGLCIECLDNRPGIYSARYLESHTLTDIISEVNATGDLNRNAKFVCVITLLDKNGMAHVFRGECCGHIGEEPRGSNGFGYDPIVYFGDKSVAEMTDTEKDKISHRGKALVLLEKDLKNGNYI